MAHFGGGKQKKWKEGEEFSVSRWHFVIFPHNLKEEVSTSANDLRRKKKKRKPIQHSVSHVFSFFPPLPSSPPSFYCHYFVGREREREKREAKKRHFSLFSFHFSAKVEGGGGGFKPPTPFFPFRLSRLRIIGVRRWKSPNHHLPPFMLCRNGGGGIFSFLFFSSFPRFLIRVAASRESVAFPPPPIKRRVGVSLRRPCNT